jgi:hypothetical protein
MQLVPLRCGDDEELALHDADLACVVADLARSLPGVDDVDKRTAPRDPWEDYLYRDRDREHGVVRRGGGGDDAADDDARWRGAGGGGGLRAAGTDLDEEWAGAAGAAGAAGGGGGSSLGGATAVGVPLLGKGRQALLRRLWASHRLRQEIQQTLGEVKTDPPKSWAHLHLAVGGIPAPEAAEAANAAAAATLFDAEVGLYTLNEVDPWLESARFQPLNLKCDILAFLVSSSLWFQIQRVPLH